MKAVYMMTSPTAAQLSHDHRGRPRPHPHQNRNHTTTRSRSLKNSTLAYLANSMNYNRLRGNRDRPGCYRVPTRKRGPRWQSSWKRVHPHLIGSDEPTDATHLSKTVQWAPSLSWSVATTRSSKHKGKRDNRLLDSPAPSLNKQLDLEHRDVF